MKKIYFSWMVLLISTFATNLHAQICGTLDTTSYENNTLRNGLVSQDPVCIEIVFHIVRQTNGSGGFNPSNIDFLVEDLNSRFNPHDIYIHKKSVDFIDNTTYYYLSDSYTFSEFNDLIEINNDANSINFYIVDTAPWFGRAERPGRNLVLQSSYAMTPISSHELGHCLNLYHTHRGSGGCGDNEGCAEINGDSENCGDEVEDTPADPCLQNQVNALCEYTGGGGYNPDPTNLMSYAPETCLNNFTPGQGERMLNAIHGLPELQPIIGQNCIIPTIIGPEKICDITTYTLQNGGGTVSWNVSSNLNSYFPSTTGITVNPINNFVSGHAYIEAVLPFSTFREDVWIGKPHLLLAKLNSGELLTHTSPNLVCQSEQITTDISIDGADNVTWTMINSSHTTTWYQEGENISFYLWAVNHNVSFRVTLSNACGTFYKDYTFQSKNCSGEDDPCKPSLTISQNPVDTEIEVNLIPGPCNPPLESRIGNDNQIFEDSSAVLYDFTGTPAITQTPFRGKLDVAHLKPGLYFLEIQSENGNKSFRIVIQ